MGSQAPARPDQHSLILSCILPHIHHTTPHHTTPHHRAKDTTQLHIHSPTPLHITLHHNHQQLTTKICRQQLLQPKLINAVFFRHKNSSSREQTRVESPGLCGCCETARPCRPVILSFGEDSLQSSDLITFICSRVLEGNKNPSNWSHSVSY